MKTSKIFAVAALSFAALTGAAHAEQYQGVLDFQGQLSRAEVQAQAVAAAHAPNQNINSSSVALSAPANPRTRAAVQAEAVAAAHDSTQNLNRSSFADSQIPATLQNNPAATSQAAL
ncbi:alpha/beta hydrolase [Xenophilus arseniciresistens]|uniref:Alpha/beta hydrolase n=1 Tax=Xenophilus arseniciresistens TaxID=1283306 RepID=A0AAE3NE12_9BURK|nr:alpha/beta hydrolase [Xenophilus arseniciresistens]MDA7419126.1 alpha/beta hydrolase [Xenophilus arseniciresistens]